MLIYTKHITNRLLYVLDLSLKRMMGLDYIVVTDQNELKNSKTAVLNYKKKKINNSFTIHPHNLLFEERILVQQVHFSNKLNKVPICFETGSRDFPFDIFAAIFYLVSRYEEYLPFSPDKHNRFPANASVAFKYNFLQIPVVNLWLNILKEKMLTYFPGLNFKNLNFEYVPTIDIDQPWAFLHKPPLRIVGGILKDILRADTSRISYRFKVMKKSLPDPFQTYPEWDDIHGILAAKLRVFILSGKTSGYDLKISPSEKAWKDMVKFVSSKYQEGIHPSYNSDLIKLQVNSEKEIIESITGKTAFRNRQHFLKIRFPNTYKNLLEIGITEDYSMGYPDQPGFRAGLAFPFPFYNLEQEVSTGFMIYPFCVMDRTLKDYLELTPFEAEETIKKLMLTVKETGGLFMSIWHNDSLSDYGEWKGWKNVYLNMIKMANSLYDVEVY